MNRFLTLVILFGISTLAGCGQTGPLYLPGHKPPIYVPPPRHNGTKISIPGQPPGK